MFNCDQQYDVPCFTVGSVHAGPTIQTIQGASLPSLSSQPGSLVSTAFPAEDEQHSQPISQQGLHYLHSAYRVGEECVSCDKCSSKQNAYSKEG